jgi:aspartate aminotransferase/aromatic-amino-acid transaminase
VKKVWVSDPTWPNHPKVVQSAGLTTGSYRYADPDTGTADRAAMLEDLAKAERGDGVIVQGPCHNPTGIDLTLEDWRALGAFVKERGLIVMLDVAYHGFAHGLDADIAGVRAFIDAAGEALISYSCSKNFGLYRERVGSLSVIAGNEPEASAAVSHVNNIVRGMYSMPPSHGGAIVAEILGDDALQQEWRAELDGMRERINGLRRLLNEKLRERNVARDFSFIERERGMFSFLGLSEAQVARLIADFGLYMVNSSRINVAGISQTNVDYVADALAAVLAD